MRNKNLPAVRPGSTLALGKSRYTLSKELGRGVWGIVFSAVDAKGNTCAIKVHKTEPGSLPWEYLLSRR